MNIKTPDKNATKKPKPPLKVRVRHYYELAQNGMSFSLASWNKPNNLYFVLITNLFIIIIMMAFSLSVIQIQGILHEHSGSLFSTPGTRDSKPFADFLDIFLNNSSKAFMTIFTGILFGIFPLYFIYTNSVIIGVVSSLVYLGSSGAVVWAGLLPHGITESIAIILSAGYGLWLGIKFFRLIIFKEKARFKDAIFFALDRYAKVIVPLLLFSAIIEAYVTPIAIKFFSK